MIISHKYKFIFIKTRKTAGTSVERALVEHCGPDDVITLDHLHQAEHDVLSEYAKNYKKFWVPVREILTLPQPINLARTLRDWVSRPAFYNHMAASSVKARISRSVWQSYYKFCFERNPWEKSISFYYWQARHGMDYGDFNEYICHRKGGMTLDQALPADWRRYAQNNKIIVDDVYDFNDLQGGLEKALEKTDFPVRHIRVELPHLKGNLRKTDFRFSDESDLAIQKIFANEIKCFGYEKPAHL